MRITYTADDGTVWNSEYECLSWERLRQLLDAQDDDFVDFCDHFGDCCVDVAGEESSMRYLFENRTKLFQLTDLMRKAIMLPSVYKAQSEGTT